MVGGELVLERLLLPSVLFVFLVFLVLFLSRTTGLQSSEGPPAGTRR